MNNLARLSRFSLVLCAVFAVLATQHVRSQPRNNYTLLWQISGNGLASPSFLFGSAHVKDNRAFRLLLLAHASVLAWMWMKRCCLRTWKTSARGAKSWKLSTVPAS